MSTPLILILKHHKILKFLRVQLRFFSVTTAYKTILCPLLKNALYYYNDMLGNFQTPTDILS